MKENELQRVRRELADIIDARAGQLIDKHLDTHVPNEKPIHLDVIGQEEYRRIYERKAIPLSLSRL